MARRKSKNETGIKRLPDIPYHDAWISYICVKCNHLNHEQIGQSLLSYDDAFSNCVWKCVKCNFIHSREADLPFENWEGKLTNYDELAAIRFWEGFFRTATENAASYWKQCNVCGRILPFAAFSKHKEWGPLERQMECRSCKGAINAVLNPKRTKEQLHESSVRRRVADLFISNNENIDFTELFKRFNGRCFKTKKILDINDRSSWAVDHILPSKSLYPLTVSNAALLSKEANANKNDMWPSKFYTNNELIELARITGANLELISSKTPIVNKNIDVNNAVQRYLSVRENSDLPKRIVELNKIIRSYDLVSQLSEDNRILLGL